MKAIPAIDILKGRCVRLLQGDYQKVTIYHESPVEIAIELESRGISHLHVVDLDGAKGDNLVNEEVVKKICYETNLKVDFGGGVRSTEIVGQIFSLGVNQITGGSVAVKSPEVFQSWLSLFGTEKIILGADTLNGNIKIKGWTENTEETVDTLVERFLPYGLTYLICTDISKDGMLAGPNALLYKRLLSKFSHLKIIASGGIGKLDDLLKLRDIGLYATIVGKAWYEGKISTDQLAKFNAN